MTQNAPLIARLNQRVSGLFTAGENGVHSVNTDLLDKAPRNDVRQIQKQLSEAGLYVGEGHKYYMDGRSGGMMDHALRVAGDRTQAAAFITQTSLTDTDLSKLDVMYLQTSLNGWRQSDKPLKVDGEFGKRTAEALRDFLRENPEHAQNMAPSLKAKLDKLAPPSETRPQAAPNAGVATPTTSNVQTFHPEVTLLMKTNPERIPYIEKAMQYAQEGGIDPIRYANQIMTESAFRVDPAENRSKARGIAQFTESTARQVGLTPAERLNPDKALRASVGLMKELETRYGGDAVLAEASYNGGPGAVKFAQRVGGVTNGEEWIAFNQRRHDAKNNQATAPGAWHNETLHYVKSNDPDLWSEAQWKRELRNLGGRVEMPEHIAAKFRGEQTPALAPHQIAANAGLRLAEPAPAAPVVAATPPSLPSLVGSGIDLSRVVMPGNPAVTTTNLTDADRIQMRLNEAFATAAQPSIIDMVKNAPSLMLPQTEQREPESIWSPSVKPTGYTPGLN
jgi:soluble lytic murein transglycosylase-like protein